MPVPRRRSGRHPAGHPSRRRPAPRLRLSGMLRGLPRLLPRLPRIAVRARRHLPLRRRPELPRRAERLGWLLLVRRLAGWWRGRRAAVPLRPRLLVLPGHAALHST
ncbi:hypothetical protein [Streptomyces mimosae]|uniref:hypothetical protein n=1 Tax=Streptomyces mimosae TaxID=2586635 RepID=UPI00186B5136|nr:hypothetical protein [Streptomyces mimosae]